MPEDFILYAHSLSEKDKASFFAENSFLLRGNITDGVFDMLEANGAVYTPKRAAKQLADDKYKAFCFFDKLGVKQPNTLQVETCGINCGGNTNYGRGCSATSQKLDITGLSRQFELIKQQLGLPFIAKPRYGSMGRNIALIKNEEQLRDALQKDTPLLFQEFIETKTDFQNRSDLRFFVIGGKVAACVLRIAPDGESIASNAHQGGLMKAYNAPKELEKLAISVIARAGLDYGTADFLQPSANAEKPLLCEINACPGFEALETQLNISIAEQIIDYVLKLKQFL
ncbi:MAG: hypothetical protein PUF61_03145 [Spirochaetales bacterium]|nr:hypothetical protein [Spirochaetales bacterium]